LFFLYLAFFVLLSFFLLHITTTTDTCTLSLHDALPIFILSVGQAKPDGQLFPAFDLSSEPSGLFNSNTAAGTSHSVDFATALDRSEEHTSELQSRENLVCRLLLEKKKNKNKLI